MLRKIPLQRSARAARFVKPKASTDGSPVGVAETAATSMWRCVGEMEQSARIMPNHNSRGNCGVAILVNVPSGVVHWNLGP